MNDEIFPELPLHLQHVLVFVYRNPAKVLSSSGNINNNNNNNNNNNSSNSSSNSREARRYELLLKSSVLLRCILTTRYSVRAAIFQPLSRCPLPVHSQSGNEAGDVCEKLDDSAAVNYLTVGNNVCLGFCLG